MNESDISDITMSKISEFFQNQKNNDTKLHDRNIIDEKRKSDYKRKLNNDIDASNNNKKKSLIKVIDDINIIDKNIVTDEKSINNKTDDNISNETTISKKLNDDKIVIGTMTGIIHPTRNNLTRVDGLNIEIERNGIIKTFQVIVRFEIEDKFIELLNNNKEYIIDNYMKFILVLLYYDNLSFLKIFNDHKEFKENVNIFCNEFIKFCAFTSSQYCLDYLLRLIGINCKFMIINNMLMMKNYGKKDICHHKIMLDIINIASQRGNILILKKYIIEKTNMHNEINDDYLNIVLKKTSSLPSLNPNSSKETNEFDIFSRDILSNILRMRNKNSIQNNELTKKMNIFLGYINGFSEIDENYTCLSKRSYLDCIIFYENNIKCVSNIFDALNMCGTYLNEECFNYFIDKFDFLNANETTIINDYKNKFELINDDKNENMNNEICSSIFMKKQIFKILITSKIIITMETKSKLICEEITNIVKSNENIF